MAQATRTPIPNLHIIALRLCVALGLNPLHHAGSLGHAELASPRLPSGQAALLASEASSALYTADETSLFQENVSGLDTLNFQGHPIELANDNVTFGTAVADGDKRSAARDNVSRGIGDAVTSIYEGAVNSIKNIYERAVNRILDATASVVGGTRETPATSPNSSNMRNAAVILVVAAILLSTFVGFGFDYLNVSNLCGGAGRPQAWLLMMLLASYAVLIPGLFTVLFGFVVQLDILGFKFTMTRPSGNNSNPGPVSESLIRLVGLLLDTHGYVGAFLIFAFAFVVPALKLAFLFVGELWRNSDDPGRVKWSRRFITCVQLISKWACPDIFAYVMLFYLFSDLNQAYFISADASLDTGFTCFAVFCVCSTISALAIRLPEAAEAEQPQEDSTATESQPASRTIVPISIMGLFVVFVILLYYGVSTPCMGLRINENIILQPNGPVPRIFSSVVSTMIRGAESDVSILGCIRQLFAMTAQGDLNCLIALILLVVFALGLSFLDMALLVISAFEAHASTGARGDSRSKAWIASHYVGHLAMLDVCVVGVLVICLAGAAYESMGATFAILPGLPILAAAEIVHYLTSFFLRRVVDGQPSK